MLEWSVYNSESTDLDCFKVILPLFTVCLDVRMVSLLQSTCSSATTQIEIWKNIIFAIWPTYYFFYQQKQNSIYTM